MKISHTRPGHRLLVVAILLTVLTALAVVVASCGTPTPTSYTAPGEGDYSSMTWSQAFEAFHKKFSKEYAFTEWKGVNWKSLYDKYAPMVREAEAKNDSKAYTIAVREYVLSIPDGHVSFRGGDPTAMLDFIGGSFGLNVIKLDNGRVVVIWVKEDGPAAAAGITVGAEIVQWGDFDAGKALADTSTLGSTSGIATNEGVLLAQERFLTRGPVGSQKSVTFKNPAAKGADPATSQSEPVTKTLTAYADLELESDQHLYPDIVIPPEANLDMTFEREQSMVTARTLSGDIGYVRILSELDLPEQAKGDHTPTVQLFRRALEGFTEQGTKGVVVDIRNNHGGSDSMVTELLGTLYDKKTFYEYQNYVNPETGQFEIWVSDESPEAVEKAAALNDSSALYKDPGQGISIMPVAPHFTQPVVAIVNNSCISSGEGIAMGIRNLSNCRVTGYYATNGSFGMAGDTVKMPGAINVSFPFGQSLDKNKVVQIDSKGMKGGISPNERVPLTYENAMKMAAGVDVELESARSIIEKLSK